MAFKDKRDVAVWTEISDLGGNVISNGRAIFRSSNYKYHRLSATLMPHLSLFKSHTFASVE